MKGEQRTIKTFIQWYTKKRKPGFPIIYLLIMVLGPILDFLKVPPIIQAFTSILGFTLLMVDIVLESFSSAMDDFRKSMDTQISSTNKQINSIVQIIEGTKHQNKEPDVIKRILEIKLEKEITDLIKFDNLPITLVPGGDIAMIMTQEEYKTLLKDLLKLEWQDIKWTTFTPFETLNEGLSVRTSGDLPIWAKRNSIEDKNNYLQYSFSGNENFFNYISSWFTNTCNKEQVENTCKKEQVIILSQEQSHPLYYQKYLSYPYYIDFFKYLVARYGVINSQAAQNTKEIDFAQHISTVLEVDKKDTALTKWVYLEDIFLLKSFQNIHHLDFVMFQGKCRFVLVRVDPANYLKRDGGLVGITFLVYIECNVSAYENFFNEMRKKSKNSLEELIGEKEVKALEEELGKELGKIVDNKALQPIKGTST